MPSIFSRIIAGDVPGRFVWRDDRCVAFLAAAPITAGHTLVVPIEEIEQWTDAEPDLLAHLLSVARRIGRAQQHAWGSPRAGLLAQGFEVPHLHLHVWPAASAADFDFRRVDSDPDPSDMDAAAAKLRGQLVHDGHGDQVAQPG